MALPPPDLPFPLEARRQPEVVSVRLRESSLQDISSDPLFDFESAAPVERVWRGTCRILTPSGTGSGFFVDGEADGTLVVTNAHVTGFNDPVCVEWMDGATIVRRSATVLAIDYPHDLAILTVAPGPTALGPTLALGDPPRPGDEVWLCGYPLGVETPRLTRALVSGWDVYSNHDIADGFNSAALVLDGSINFGNSGGPLRDGSGRVVGVVCAQSIQKLFLAPSVPGLPKKHQRALRELADHLNTGTGIGFALHLSYIRQMRDALKTVPPRAREPYRPDRYQSPMARRDFVALQLASLGAKGGTTIGPYSFTQAREFFVGWHNDRVAPVGRIPGWSQLVPWISSTGGSFFLLGFDVRLYRRRQDGRGGYYTAPVHLRLSE